MLIHRQALMVAALVLLLPAVAWAQLPTLSVVIKGLEPPTGGLEVTLFNSAQDFMKKPFLQQSAQLNGETEYTFTFSSVLEGKYAVVVVHDENGNQVLDTGFLGFGGESVGYSNDAAPWLGRPSFEAAAFEVGADDLQITVKLE